MIGSDVDVSRRFAQHQINAMSGRNVYIFPVAATLEELLCSIRSVVSFGVAPLDGPPSIHITSNPSGKLSRYPHDDLAEPRTMTGCLTKPRTRFQRSLAGIRPHTGFLAFQPPDRGIMSATSDVCVTIFIRCLGDSGILAYKRARMNAWKEKYRPHPQLYFLTIVRPHLLAILY